MSYRTGLENAEDAWNDRDNDLDRKRHIDIDVVNQQAEATELNDNVSKAKPRRGALRRTREAEPRARTRKQRAARVAQRDNEALSSRTRGSQEESAREHARQRIGPSITASANGHCSGGESNVPSGDVTSQSEKDELASGARKCGAPHVEARKKHDGTASHRHEEGATRKRVTGKRSMRTVASDARTTEMHHCDAGTMHARDGEYRTTKEGATGNTDVGGQNQSCKRHRLTGKQQGHQCTDVNPKRHTSEEEDTGISLKSIRGCETAQIDRRRSGLATDDWMRGQGGRPSAKLKEVAKKQNIPLKRMAEQKIARAKYEQPKPGKPRGRGQTFHFLGIALVE